MDHNVSFYDQNARSMKKASQESRRPYSVVWLSAISLKRDEIKQLLFLCMCVCLHVCFQRIKTHPKASNRGFWLMDRKACCSENTYTLEFVYLVVIMSEMPIYSISIQINCSL